MQLWWRHRPPPWIYTMQLDKLVWTKKLRLWSTIKLTLISINFPKALLLNEKQNLSAIFFVALIFMQLVRYCNNIHRASITPTIFMDLVFFFTYVYSLAKLESGGSLASWNRIENSFSKRDEIKDKRLLGFAPFRKDDYAQSNDFQPLQCSMVISINLWFMHYPVHRGLQILLT